MATWRVLVVDDDSAVREALAHLLASEGFELDQAENGYEALQLLREQPHPDVILLDLTMPVMSGWEFRQVQLADPELSKIPVIVMSAVDMSDVPASAKLAKPCDLRHLVDTVRVVANHHAGSTPDATSSWPC